jgi:hypothetical protein
MVLNFAANVRGPSISEPMTMIGRVPTSKDLSRRHLRCDRILEIPNSVDLWLQLF